MRTLLLLALAFVSIPVSAEELQVTIAGVACTLAPPDCGQGTYTTPFTITYDINSTSGLQTSSVGQQGFGEVLDSYHASNLAVTNYSAILGGQSVVFAAHTTGNFGFEVEGQDVYDFSGGVSSPSKMGFGFDSFSTPFVTASEFATFQDPLASLLLTYRSTGGCSVCFLYATGDPLDFTPLSGRMTIVAVPSPGPLLLFLTGLVGITLSLRGKGSPANTTILTSP
jgi:hypothetical protein